MREDFLCTWKKQIIVYRLKKRGIPSYVVPKSIIIHKGSESFKNNKCPVLYYRRRNYLYFEKYHYKKSILSNLKEKIGIYNLIKYFIKYLIRRGEKTIYII